jgi:hypothetical protein
MRVWSARVEQSDHDAGPVAMNRGGIAAADVDGRASSDHSLGGAVLWAKVTLMSGAPPMSSGARLVVVFAALVCCALWAAPAAAARSYRSAGVAPAGSVVLADSFKPITAGADSVTFWTSGNYLLLQNTIQNGTSKGWSVINDQTGTTTSLDPQCNPEGLGPPSVLMSCPLTSNPYGPGDVELYSLTDGTRQTVTPSPGLPPQCPQPDVETECAGADAVGADWIRWDATCYHCADTYFFQNIKTGQLRDDPTNATTFADLNSPALAHNTCPGVQLMRNLHSYGMGWGSLTPDGQFALAIGTDNSVFLERCGTRMRRLLANGNTVASYALASNSSAIVWQAVTSQLNGLFLPSLQTFTIPLPSANGLVGSLGLTSGALYVSGFENGVVWRSASPTVLPFNTSRPTLTRSGSTLSCRRGSWRNAVRFSYAWQVNGKANKDAKPRLAVGKALKRRSVSCSVTASNAAGTTTASSAQLHVR